jgi:hypothetical protein
MKSAYPVQENTADPCGSGPVTVSKYRDEMKLGLDTMKELGLGWDTKKTNVKTVSIKQDSKQAGSKGRRP